MIDDNLAAYLPKIATQGRPILIVDGFAGRGRFVSREEGSPLIICQAVGEALGRQQPLRVPVRVETIESDADLHRHLSRELSQFSFATTHLGRFEDHLPRLVEAANNHNIFLYLDPYTVEGLNWLAMHKLFEQVGIKHSIEVLLNFNTISFVRRGLAAIVLAERGTTAAGNDNGLDETATDSPPSIDRLNNVVGGDWWQTVLSQTTDFPQQVQLIATKYCEMLRQHFAEVCYHAVKAEPHHDLPKYHLVFASRHPDALRLMNDEMVKSRNVLAERATSGQPTLFETRSYELVPDYELLPRLILCETGSKLKRGKVIANVIRNAFGEFTSSEIRGGVEKLLKEGQLKSATGKPRINDEVQIWRV